MILNIIDIKNADRIAADYMQTYIEQNYDHLLISWWLRRGQDLWLGGGPNYKLHAMTSTKVFKRENFSGAKIS